MATTRQMIARERNWNIVQIIGNCNNLRRVALDFGRGGIEQQLINIRERLLKDNDEKWQRQKDKL